MGTFDVAARHGGVPGLLGHSELVQQSAACYSDKYGHQDTWQCKWREREKGDERLNGTEWSIQSFLAVRYHVLGQILVLCVRPMLRNMVVMGN